MLIKKYLKVISIFLPDLRHNSQSLSAEEKNKENEAVNFDSLLKSIEQSKEASKLLIAVNRRIETLSQKRSQLQGRIDENYTINLLDDMWILMGFADIAEEYSQT